MRATESPPCPKPLPHPQLLFHSEGDWLRTGTPGNPGSARYRVASPQGLLPTEVVFGWKAPEPLVRKLPGESGCCRHAKTSPVGLGSRGRATEAEGLAPATQRLATFPGTSEDFLSQGCWGRCLDGTGWAWERLTQECQVGLSLSGLSLFSFCLFSLSGVPGKKCGTIILSAEELSNCRVSSRAYFSTDQDYRSLEGAQGRQGSS